MRKETGFTLIEVLIATAVLATVAVGILSALAYCLNLQDISQNLTIAVIEARARIEEIRNTKFSEIEGTYNDRIFNITGLNGKGRIDITKFGEDTPDEDENERLIEVRIVICWQQRHGRIIGEDNGSGGGVPLDGQLNGTEDANGNTKLDSPCEVTTSIANKGL